MITVAPNTVVCLEFGSINQTFAVTPTNPLDAIVITGASIIGDATGFDITFDDVASTVTVTGSIEDVFQRSLHYVDNNKVNRVVHHFVDLPESYIGVFKYVPPIETNRLLPIKIDYDYDAGTLGTFVPMSDQTTTLDVQPNHALANAAFSASVNNGSA